MSRFDGHHSHGSSFDMYMIFGFCYKKKKKTGKESQYMFSRPELGSDQPIGLDRESGRDNSSSFS